MSVFQYKTGLGNSSAYQVSAAPCVISGTALHDSGNKPIQEINFTNVTNFIQISSSGDLNVGFSSLGISANDNYFEVSAGLSSIYYWRASSIYVQKAGSGSQNRNFAIIAGLTMVPAAELSNNWSGSAGVG
tara:strand:- start:2067 stop:2459 length:393 start_codon:yes stop_codon:yes gene_type:complete